MAIPSWPANIKYAVERSSFQESENPNDILRTEMNSGTGRQRRQYTMAITVQQVVINMTNAEYAVFVGFYNNTLGRGAARFTMPVWNTAVLTYVTRTVAIKAGSRQVTPSGTRRQKVGMTLLVESLYG